MINKILLKLFTTLIKNKIVRELVQFNSRNFRWMIGLFSIIGIGCLVTGMVSFSMFMLLYGIMLIIFMMLIIMKQEILHEEFKEIDIEAIARQAQAVHAYLKNGCCSNNSCEKKEE